MAIEPEQFENSRLQITVDNVSSHVTILFCDVAERIGEPYTITCDVVMRDRSAQLSDFVSSQVHIEYNHEDEPVNFHGLCVRAERIETHDELLQFKLVIRPNFWRLTQRRNCKVFQDKTAMEIIQEVMELGGIHHHDIRVSSELPQLEYCVQYNETDYDFIMRLCEEHGVHYHFLHSQTTETIVFCSAIADHDFCPEHMSIPYNSVEEPERSEVPNIFRWVGSAQKSPDKISTTDYDFTNAGLDLAVLEMVTEGSATADEIYSYPGDHMVIAEGDRLTRIRAEAAAVHSFEITAETNVHVLIAGEQFTLTDYNDLTDGDYLVIGTLHHFKANAGQSNRTVDEHTGAITVIPTNVPFRMPPLTPRPVIAGLQSAVVVGPEGEEIYTDEYGRIKIQFHWDRIGEKNENSSLFVQVATPWAGMGWGQIAVPRIGHEVIVQFRNGNPSRPVVTGMLYNSDNPVPLSLGDDAHTSGVKTNSTPGGGGANEFWMCDTAGAEVMTHIAQRDYVQRVKHDSTVTIQNDATVHVGYEVGDPGSYVFNVHQDRIESVSNGDYNLGVDTGNRNTFIKTNDNLEVEGIKYTKVTGNVSEEFLADHTEVTTGKLSEKAANVEYEGTTDLKIKSPDVNIDGTTDVKIGSKAIEINGTELKLIGSSKISLTVGGSTIELSSGGIKINGSKVDINC